MELLEKALHALKRYPLCDHCLGRPFALLGYGLDNQKRGESLKTLLTMEGHDLTFSKPRKGISQLKTLASNGNFSIAAELLQKMGKTIKQGNECYLCEERFEFLDEIVSKLVVSLKDYEYETFLVGIKLPVSVEEREDEFMAKFNVVHGENIRNEFSREIGKRIYEVTKKDTNYKTPEVTIIVNPFTEQVDIQANPLYIAGRYKKLSRGLPQSKWFCRECRGDGCEKCNWTGKMYPESIEEIVVTPTLEKTSGETALFHAAGREDIDAKMLGRGRPFVVEIKKPKKRYIDLKILEKNINEKSLGKVTVLDLQSAKKNAVTKLKKMESTEKSYKTLVTFSRTILDDEIRNLDKILTNTIVRQQTPLRVLHRRSDRIREKHIYETKTKRLSSNCVEMRIRCQGGLYIKELITGDEGRTNPSVTELVGAMATPQKLDVLSVGN